MGSPPLRAMIWRGVTRRGASALYDDTKGQSSLMARVTNRPTATAPRAADIQSTWLSMLDPMDSRVVRPRAAGRLAIPDFTRVSDWAPRVSRRETRPDPRSCPAPIRPPTMPRPPINIWRNVQPRSSRAVTRVANTSASARIGEAANCRSRSISKVLSDMSGLRVFEGAPGRHPRPELIQTTFDMRFDRSQWRIQGEGRLDMRKAAPVAERDADAFRGREGAQGFVEVDAVGGAGFPAPWRGARLRRFGHQVQAGVAAPAPDVEPRGDALHPRLEGPLAAEVGDLLEGRQEGVLGEVVGENRIGSHAAQQAADRRPVPSHEFAEGVTSAGDGQRHQVEIVD